jgi:hypothetical protein
MEISPSFVNKNQRFQGIDKLYIPLGAIEPLRCLRHNLPLAGAEAVGVWRGYIHDQADA